MVIKVRTYCWRVPEPGENGTDGCPIHTVTCALSRLRGKLFVTVDGETYDLPAGLLGVSAARREMLQVGEMKALLVLTRAGKASLIVEGNTVDPEMGQNRAASDR